MIFRLNTLAMLFLNLVIVNITILCKYTFNSKVIAWVGKSSCKNFQPDQVELVLESPFGFLLCSWNPTFFYVYVRHVFQQNPTFQAHIPEQFMQSRHAMQHYMTTPHILMKRSCCFSVRTEYMVIKTSAGRNTCLLEPSPVGTPVYCIPLAVVKLACFQ